jgi:Lipoprotein LpqB beta-propeller domain/Sporulation and spore germination
MPAAQPWSRFVPRGPRAGSQSRRWRWAAGAVAGLALALTGCAGVPQSGSVHLGRSLPAGGQDEPDSQTQEIAAAPTPGMTPTRVVDGFLAALVDNQADYVIARLYLAPGAVWHPTTSTTMYNGKTTVRSGTSAVNVTLGQVGTIDTRGAYHVAPATLHAHFVVVRSGGQWRISRLPDGVLLSTSDVSRPEPSSIYFFNRAQTHLVPDPLLFPPDQPGLATTLIHELVEGGPGHDLAPAVSTAVPHGTGLLGTVPIDANGVASVDLAGSVQQVSAGQLERLSAQIVWTLRQLPSVTAVRLLVNGSPLSVPGIQRVQPIDSWARFDPDAPPAARGALGSDVGHIVGIAAPVPASLSNGGRLSAPAVSADGSMVAALASHGSRTVLRVGPPTGVLTSRLSASVISAPAFDPQGDVLVAVGAGARSRIAEVPPIGAVRRVTVAASIRALGITALAVSRDGSRIALVAGPPGDGALFVGAVAGTAGRLSVVNAQVVIPATSDVAGVAWQGANQIVTTVRRSAHRRAVLETGVDGYSTRLEPEGGLPPTPTLVAAAPNQPLLAFAGGSIWTLSDVRWQRVRTGSDPSYAG